MQVLQVPGIYFGYPRQGDTGRRGVSPVAICHHIMQGTMAAYLRLIKGQLPGYENCANFSIGLDGTIRQHVRMQDAAWTNGLDWHRGGPTYWQSDPALTWLVEAYEKRLSPNEYTVSIELEGYTGNPTPAAQLDSLVWLDRMIMEQYPAILPDRVHLVGHYQIDGINKRRCPGSGVPWVTLLTRLQPAENPAYKLCSGTMKEYLLQHPELGVPLIQSTFTRTGDEIVQCTTSSAARYGAWVLWRRYFAKRGIDPFRVVVWE